MKRRFAIIAAIVIVIAGFSARGADRGATPRKLGPPTPVELPPGAASISKPPSWFTSPADTQVLGSWSFDDGLGGPDPQGWTSVDLTAQIDTFFHVDDFAGLDGGSKGGLVALSGSKSLWCGTRTLPSVCQYTLPGYGNNWDQRFESVPFAVSGDVTVDYLVRYDSEGGYDYTYFEYRSKSGVWQTLVSHTGEGESTVSVMVPADSLDGTAQFRFRFLSEGAFSDADGLWPTDGAVIIDNISVQDINSLVDHQHFESDAVGALTTNDGDWSASVRTPYGDFTALFNGTTVVQEDSLISNTSHLWGFFSGSTADYACGGHPGQTAVPYPVDTGEAWPSLVALENEIRSPLIPVTEDMGGAPVDSIGSLLLEFDVYRDLPLDAVVYYAFRVRSLVGGCYQEWRGPNLAYYSDTKDWFRFQGSLLEYIEPEATHIQVAIQALDLCPFYCSTQKPGDCHSHAPLVDNVRVVTAGSDHFVVTNASDSGPGTLRQAILDANANPNGSYITFEIPSMILSPPSTITLSSPLPQLTRPTILDARLPGFYSGTPLVVINGGTANMGHIDIDFGGSGSGVYGLTIRNPAGPGIAISAENCVVQACVVELSDPGIRAGGHNVIVGGLGPDEANVIRTNIGDGIACTGLNVTMRGNQIWNNGGLGIDLGANGINANDPLDIDIGLGANHFQNYPVITAVDSAWTIRGYLDSAPSQTYTLDFYANSACSDSGYGEGETWIGEHVVTTDHTGRAAFALDIGPLPHPFVTATATDYRGNTSEFSPCFEPVMVTNTNDSGPGSLRQAIVDINRFQGGGIEFNIPGGSPQVINLLSTLPAFDYPVFIDGFSQPGSIPNNRPVDQPSNHGIVVEVRGFPLWLAGGLSTIRGLAIGGSSSRGIFISGPGGNIIEGCHIGLNHDGTSTVPNLGDGIRINTSHGNTIGGTSPAARMIVSGNTGDGIIAFRSDSTLIQGCFVGIDATGQLDMGNQQTGIRLDRAEYCKVGGTEPGARNVSSGNDWDQIYMQGGIGSWIAGNYAGIDISGSSIVGTFPQGLGSGGIGLGGSFATLGGSDPAARNVVAGTPVGVHIFAGTNHVVQGNYFGTDATGQPLGLSRHGALLWNAKNCLIGGTNPGEGNLFAGADSAGVAVVEYLGSSFRNRIVGNSVHSNGMLGIDLGNDGITNNDIGDLDDGPNDLQNYPQILQNAVSVAGSTYVSLGIFTSAEVFTADLYYSGSCDPSGNGEGEFYLGSAVVDMTPGSGIGSVPVTVPGVVPAGAYLTATLTDATGNTSEFSPCGVVSNAPAGTNVESIPVDSTTGETPVTLTFSEITITGNTFLTSGSSGPPLPGGFLTSDSSYYDLTTTATFTGDIEVCVAYDEALLTGAESNARIMHYDTMLTPDQWVDVTTSVDTVANVVCGTVSKLSPFALMVGTASSVRTETLPAMRSALHQNVPNPFNPTTTIGYDIAAGGADVALVIYDVAGRRVRTLVDRRHTAGSYRARWDGYNDRGSRVATGVYFYRLTAGSFVQTRKMLLLK